MIKEHTMELVRIKKQCNAFNHKHSTKELQLKLT